MQLARPYWVTILLTVGGTLVTTFSGQLPEQVQLWGFLLGIVITLIGFIGFIFHWQKARVATKHTPPISPTEIWKHEAEISRRESEIQQLARSIKQLTVNQASRLSQIKKQLRNHTLEVDQMYDKILAEKVATQSLPEAERNERLRVFSAPDCRRWHSDVEALVEKELGRSQANEFASDWKHLEAGNWPTDLDFLMKFLSRKKHLLRDLAKSITEADLE